jgi:ATP-dependent Lon protease
VKRKMDIVPVSNCDEVLARALVNELTPIEWNESEEDVQTTRAPQGEDAPSGVLTH